MNGIEEPFVDAALLQQDLSTLFDSNPGAPQMKLKKGLVIEWDPTTRQSRINVEGSSVYNLPTLDFGTAVPLAVNDVVGILAYGKAWFILGRILTPLP